MKTASRVAALTAATGVILGLAVAAFAQTAAPAKRLEVAKLTADGNLRKPADLDNWVFLGTSLGMAGGVTAAKLVPGWIEGLPNVVAVTPLSVPSIDGRSVAVGAGLVGRFD